MKIRLTFLLISIFLFVPAIGAADQEAGNSPYVKTDQFGRCYAKSFPKKNWGTDGVTSVFILNIYRKNESPETLNATYPWFAKGLFVHCLYNREPGKSVAIIRTGGWSQGRQASDYSLAFEFYLDGKLMKRYSTLDIALNPDNVSASVSHYTYLKKREIRHEKKHGWIFFIETLDGREVRFNLRDGTVITTLDKNDNQKILFDAIRKGNLEQVQKSIKTGTVFDIPFQHGGVRPYGWTPLHYAVMLENIDIVKYLIKSGADVNVVSFDKKNPKETAEKAPSPDSMDEPPSRPQELSFSIFGGGVEEEDMLGHTPLYDSILKGNIELVRLLLENGANPVIPSGPLKEPALFALAQNPNIEIAQLLTKQIPSLYSPNYLGQTIMEQLIFHEKTIPLAEFFLKNGFDVNFQKPEDESIKRLTMGGKKFIFNKSLLQIAATISKGKFTELFLKYGADINFQNLRGSPLHSAARNYSSTEPMKILLDMGADLEVKSNSGNTPLHSAVELGRHKNVSFLLKQGANPHAKNDENLSPYDLAIKSKKPKLIKLFEKFPPPAKVK